LVFKWASSEPTRHAQYASGTGLPAAAGSKKILRSAAAVWTCGATQKEKWKQRVEDKSEAECRRVCILT
jgi:hypothetical protein